MSWRPVVCLLGAILSGAVAAGERLWIDGRGLDLTAQTRACYLGFLKLYDVDYFHAGAGEGSCIRVSYLRDIAADTLAEATAEVFAERHGEAVADRHRAEIDQVAGAYRAVAPGDQYLYCTDPERGGRLLRDSQVVAELPSVEFARRFLQIWVREESPDRQPTWAFGTC